MKTVIVGHESTGKTSIANYYIYQSFNDSIEPTIGVEFYTHIVFRYQRNIKHIIWSISSQDKQLQQLRQVFNNIQAAIIVYSINDENSFNRIDYWLNILIENNPSSDFNLYLVGNKIDFKEYRVISYELGYKKAISIGAHFFETSGKTGESINELFNSLESTSEVAVKHSKSNTISNSKSDTNSNPNSKSKSKCQIS